MITKIAPEQMQELKHFMLLAQIGTIGSEISLVESRIETLRDNLRRDRLSSMEIMRDRNALDELLNRHEVLDAQRTKLHTMMGMVKSGNI